MADACSALGAARYVSLTTFRRTGEPVPTPVWVASDGEALVVTTGRRTGKVTRLRHNPAVLISPCTRTGVVAPDAPRVSGVAEVVEDPDRVAAGLRALATKYGLVFRMLALTDRLRGRRAERVLLRLTGG